MPLAFGACEFLLVKARTISGALRRSLELAHEEMGKPTVDLVEVRRITVINEEEAS